jgi:hypothetical protein
MKKKPMTIDDLALMTQRGFNDVNEKIVGEVGSLREEMNDRFEQVDARFEQVDKRFDHIENLVLRAHDNRIEKIEDDVRVLKTALRVK